MLGYLSSLLLARTQHRQALTLRVADEYFAVRRELVALVSELADLTLKDEISQRERFRRADAVGSLFYKDFDLLPRPVLDRLILLHVALRTPQRGPYRIEATTVIPMTRADVVTLVERCSIFANSMFMAPLALNSRNHVARDNQVIKLHARDVLRT